MAKILVVDDDESILDALTYILEDAGHAVAAIPKGEWVYKKIQTFKPTIILLDILLSGTDGRTICMKLKKDRNTKNIPIVMISAHPSARVSSVKAGADDFIAKPFGIEELLRKVKKYTALNH